MKKKLIIATSLVALVLSLTLFAVSVFAAVTQTFGVSNKITFRGLSEYIVFQLDGEITGTTIDGDPCLTHSWYYNFNESDSNFDSWDIEKTLAFNREGVEEGEEFILYSFNIQNLSNQQQDNQGKDIKVYISVSEIDTEVLSYELVGTESSPIVISAGNQDGVSLKLKPLMEFEGERDCNFTIHILEN